MIKARHEIKTTNDEVHRQLERNTMFLPKLIQAGMGVNISSPGLANACARLSQPGKDLFGTISGTALERVMAMMLQKGDAQADKIVKLLEDFPFPEMAKQVIDKYYNKPKAGIPVFTVDPSKFLIILTVCAHFAFTRWAKEGHDNPISINYLDKIAMPHLYAIYGAMLGGIDFITMGAGIPIDKPAMILAYSEGRPATNKIPIVGGGEYTMSFDPEAFFGKKILLPKRPGFIPIISSNTLGSVYKKYLDNGTIPKGGIHGFVIEGWKAGGHNAGPRNHINYSEKDEVNFQKIAELGFPFWIAGTFASPEGLAKAISMGAEGIQVGSAFALCEQSGLRPDLRRQAISDYYHGALKIKTDFRASPTGYPFKVAGLEGTVSEDATYEARRRVCDQSALVHLYRKADGKTIGYRCPSEPIKDYLRKGGKLEDTVDRKCICNGLVVTAGLGDANEPPIVTLGDDLSFLPHLALKDGVYSPDGSYTAEDAVRYIFSAS